VSEENKGFPVLLVTATCRKDDMIGWMWMKMRSINGIFRKIKCRLRLQPLEKKVVHKVSHIQVAIFRLN
jgi:hypothetical protein